MRAGSGRSRSFARARDFDVALTHGSHELALVARSLGVPSTTAFDYEFAWLQHQLGCRAATRVVVPDAIPLERLARYGARPPKLLRYEGLKEEYYLADFEPAAEPVDGLDPDRVLVVVRTPPEVSLYHRHGNPLFAGVLDRLGRDETVQAVILPRTDEQRVALRRLRAALARRPGACGRRAEPDRGRRSRRLRGRNDEPRGRGARRSPSTPPSPAGSAASTSA